MRHGESESKPVTAGPGASTCPRLTWEQSRSGFPRRYGPIPDVVSVCREGFGLGSLVHRLGLGLRDSLPAGLLVPRRLGVRAPDGPAGGAQWLGPLPAPDEQAGHVALDAPPQHHGRSAGHVQHLRRARVRQLRLRGLLSGPGACLPWSSRPCGSVWPGRR